MPIWIGSTKVLMKMYVCKLRTFNPIKKPSKGTRFYVLVRPPVLFLPGTHTLVIKKYNCFV